MQKEKINILVTGGFHNNITNFLMKQVKIYVIKPNTKTTDKSNQDILMNKNTTYDAHSDGLLVSGYEIQTEYFL